MALMNRRLKLLPGILLISLLYLSVQAEADPDPYRGQGRVPFGTEFQSNDARVSDREGKLFSLFSIVKFKNDPCSTTVTLPSGGGGRRNGTCFTSSECRSKRGRAQGGCAAGFGVCCLFVASSSSSTINENNTYVQNPGFPSPYSDTASVSYTIKKSSSDVCTLRLDFETFSLLGTGNTADADMAGTDTSVALSCLDQFNVQVNSGQSIPTICGENSGQHIYVDIGNGGSDDSAMLSFAFTGPSSTRTWDIRVTQYPCGSENAPPSGCLQYHTSLNGRIKTFNFDSANDNHLPDQQYSVCVRQEEGYCCIQYSVCPDEELAFTLSVDTQGKVDGSCTSEDFLAIPASSSSCVKTPGIGSLVNRYCGAFLNDMQGATNNVPICDCTPPYTVDIFTNKMADSPPEASKGLCLDFTQIPC